MPHHSWRATFRDDLNVVRASEQDMIKLSELLPELAKLCLALTMLATSSQLAQLSGRSSSQNRIPGLP